MSPIRTAVLAALVLALAAPAALAGGTLTKAQVIVRGSKICRAAERQVDALPEIRSQHPFAKTAPKGDGARAIRFLAGYADALEGVRTGLGALKAPPQGRLLLTGFLAELRPTIATFRKARADALAHRYGAAEREAQRAFGLFERASAKTKAYGFPKGVCQAG